MKPLLRPNKNTRMEGRLPTVGKGPFRYQWYSICSGHSVNADGNYYNYEVDCPRCAVGTWENCWNIEISHFFYKNDPELWRWWVNRPSLVPLIKNLFFKKK